MTHFFTFQKIIKNNKIESYLKLEFNNEQAKKH